MNLPAQALTPELSVAPQLDPAAMAAAAAAGFRSVINNRPDFEGGPDQPTAAQMEAAALAAGLAYAYLPVNGAYQSPEEIAQFKQLLELLPKPVLAFCRSGARSTRLFMAATAP
ncbi:TIGR01244 family sulfur transferase [Paucibacter soli]|uniref:TIGR01244 family sulfur transferase n=1 Tax=Paucibacter soli TaxID=3133433 RepID=UPI0030A20751